MITKVIYKTPKTSKNYISIIFIEKFLPFIIFSFYFINGKCNIIICAHI